jgi:AbrB family looped-hinge helix DNA binding protein
MSNEDNKPEYCITDHFFGMATVGERGQIVIPAKARKKHRINTGDKLLIMGTPDAQGLMLVKIDAMREFMTTMIQELQRVEQAHQVLLQEKTEEADF